MRHTEAAFHGGAASAPAKWLNGTEGWREEMLSQEAIEPLRLHVRIGDQNETWLFNRRRLYAPYQVFGLDWTGYEISQEYDFLYTQVSELILVLAFIGESLQSTWANKMPRAIKNILKRTRGQAFWHCGISGLSDKCQLL